MQKRIDGRSQYDLRPYSLEHNTFGYADASVLFSLGSTKVLVSVTLQDKIPPFLRGSGSGWLTAEYAMLPTATQKRTNRELSSVSRNGRSVEISRLIGRSLRTVTDLSCLGEKTIVIDCDVLQADGGTRTACITAASLALFRAQEIWLSEKRISERCCLERIVGLSGGVLSGNPVIDLSQTEDMAADADFNYVITARGEIIELQGTAERAPVTWKTLEILTKEIERAARPLFDLH